MTTSSIDLTNTTRRQVLLGSAAILIAGSASSSVIASPVVETRNGKVRGAIEPNGTMVYRGIPYAEATGAHRFEAPRPAPSWPGIFDATQFGQICPQPPEIVAPGSELAQLFASTVPQPNVVQGENCLVLNIWTQDPRGPKRPVMVWIHGGGFATGAGSYPTYWGDGLAATGEAVVVTLNHRLNAFGYLYLAQLGGERYRDSGSAGMLDIIEALRWVKANIAAFGGDPDNVTIFGQSGGGAKVATLLAMPATEGLFHRAICQSGSAVKSLPADQATQTAQAYLAELGIARDRLDLLETVTAEKMVAALAKVGGMGSSRAGWFAPVVDGVNLPRDPFSPEAPAISRNIPLLIGCTTGEAALIGAEPADFLLTRDNLLPRLQSALHVGTAEAREVETATETDMPGASPPDIFFRAASANLFEASQIICADRKAQQHGAPVFSYLFEWRAPAFNGKYRAFHGVEHPFVFRHLDSAIGMGADASAKPLEIAMSSAWLNFAKTGNPNNPHLPHWPVYDPSSRKTMVLDTTSRVVENPYPHLRTALLSINSSNRL